MVGMTDLGITWVKCSARFYRGVGLKAAEPNTQTLDEAVRSPERVQPPRVVFVAGSMFRAIR